MLDSTIVLPSKPKIVMEEGFSGIYEIEGLYPGYGHTLGNSLRRIILSSLRGAAITSVKIDGISHEFSTIDGVKEDVITLLLNLKRVRIAVTTDEPQMLTLKAKGITEVTAASIEAPGQVTILNPELHIAELTQKNASLSMELSVRKGLGYVPKEAMHRDRVEIGTIALDAIFTPIRRVNYEVENMRVGDRTDFNRLKLFVETDGTLSPREALEKSIETMIAQLRAVAGFKETDDEMMAADGPSPLKKETGREEGSERGEKDAVDPDILKTRVESLEGLSARTVNALGNANIRTVGGLARKTEDDVLEIEGIGAKGLQEIKKALVSFGVSLR